MDNNWQDKFQVSPLSERTRKMLDNNFVYHAPKDGQALKYVALRDAAKQLAEMIYYLTPESREQSLSITSLEEAVFWANASIARNE